MENLSHSRQPNMLSKKSCNGSTNKSIYDDVFGGPPRFGAPTLSPRVEDYTEIFGGLHASRASSIPVLDLPLADETDKDVFFDVRSSGFDYSEVFGGFNGHDFALSYEELVMEQSNGYGDSSDDEAWSPAEAGNLSEELEHSAKDQCLSSGDSIELIGGDMEFNISYNRASQRSNENLSNGIPHITQLHDVSGYTFVVDKATSLSKTDSKHQQILESDDGHLDVDYSGEMLRRRQLRKAMSQPANGGNDGLLFGNDVGTRKEFVRNGSLPKMFVTISDVSLRTRPSHLPPPSRPPPALDVKNGDSGKEIPRCKNVSDETAGESSPPYFDVEVDASSSAAASAAAMKEAMEKAQAKLRSAKESMERKREGFHTRIKSGIKDDGRDKEENANKIVNGSGDRKDERGQGTSHIEEKGMEFFVIEEKKKVKKTIQLISDSLEGKKEPNVAKRSADQSHGRESSSSQGSDRIDGAGEWKEANQFFELVTNKSRKAIDLENNKNTSAHDSNFHDRSKKERKGTVEALQRLQENDKKVKPVRADHELGELEKKPEVSKEPFEWDESNGRSGTENRRKGIDKEIMVAQDASRREGIKRKVSMNNKLAEVEKQQNRADDLQKHEDFVEVQPKESKNAIRQTMKSREKASRSKEDNESTEDLKKFSYEKEDSERRQAKAFEQEENGKKLNAVLEQAENERRLKKIVEQEEKENMIKAVSEQEENEKMHREAYVREENERRLREALELVANERRLIEAHEKEENERRVQETQEREDRLRRQREAVEREEKEKRQREACEAEEYQKRMKEALEKEENERRLKATLEKEEKQRREREAFQQEENAKREREAHEREENEKREKEALKKEENERRIRIAAEQEENKRTQREAYRRENEKKQRDAREKEESEKRYLEAFQNEKIEQRIKEDGEREVGNRLEETSKQQKNCLASRKAEEIGSKTEQKEDPEPEKVEDTSAVASMLEETEKQVDFGESGHGEALGNMCEVHNAVNLAHKPVKDKNLGATRVDGRQEGSNRKLEAPEEIAHEETSKRLAELRNGENEVAFGKAQDDVEHEKSRFLVEDVSKQNIEKIRSTFQVDSDTGNQGKKFAYESSERGKNIEQTQISVKHESNNDSFMSARVVKESVVTGRTMEGAQPSILEVKGSTRRIAQEVNVSQSTDRKVKTSYETSEDKEVERVKRERELELECLRKVEEEREREREREKDRMAVDKATLETRERAYVEAHERAERAAVERATAEARQRALNEARERLEKACAEAREKSLPDKASMEARLRAERAAVERATAEARERAFEKVMAERATSEARERIERSVSDKFSASSRNSGMRPSSSSSDLQDLQPQGPGSFSSSRSQYSSFCNERFEVVEGESAQRCKARLERYRRTAERAAKALAEKNMRDLLAQREQAERNRLAENLDADVKRWSSGKEGNLRALLSTLQYILGPDSGWQPIPLTEVITAAAVKKAYRKATLCVHPDKLQQRGASIQQKYICEKVFDLLKEAWNKFNSEER